MTWWKRRREPASAAAPAVPAAPAPVVPVAPPAWPPQVAAAMTVRLLGLTERQREALDALQLAEDDPRTLELLYQLDHGNAQMRRLSRGLQILAGEPPGYGGGRAATLLDVVSMATAMVGQYQRVRVGEIADLIAPPHFAEDLGLLLAELLDNGTRYGGRATVGTYRLERGTVAVYVQDGGTGCSPDWMARVNAWLAGTVQPVGPQTGQHSGLTVVHHLLRKHGLQINISMSPPTPPSQSGPAGQGEGGTLVTVYIPAHLLAGAQQEAPPPVTRPQLPPQPQLPPEGTPDLPRRVPGNAYTGTEEQAAPGGAGGSLADLAAAFSPAPDDQERQ